jgi:DNA modification methylase
MIDLRLGDCLEVMKTIKSGSIDAIITDPPYGTTACKWDSVIDFDLMWEQLNRIIKTNGAIVLFGSEPFSSALRMSNIKNYKYDWKYEKNKSTGFLNAKRQPLLNYEDICVFYKKQCTYNPQKTKAEKVYKRGKVKRSKELNLQQSENYGEQKDFIQVDDGLRYPKRIQYFNNNFTQKQQHPTQKPITLMEYLIKTYTNKNETVLDFTMGSGSTGVAANNLNRNFIGIEQEEKYFNIARERIEENKLKLF